MNKLRLFSSDAHFPEPPDLWTTRLPKRFRDRGPALLHVEGEPRLKLHVALEGEERILAAEWVRVLRDGVPIHVDPKGELPTDVVIPVERDDPASRLRDQKLDGITAESIHPNVAFFAFETADVELAIACARVYNDHMAERYITPWQFPNAVIPIEDIDLAVAEVERCASLGFRGVELPICANPERPYFLPRYERLWAALSAHKMVACLHTGFISGFSPERPLFGAESDFDEPEWSDDPEALSAAGISERLTEGGFGGLGGVGRPCFRTIPELLAGGALERYPDLHFVFVEVGARWLAGLVDSMDDAWLERTGNHAREVRRWWILPDGKRVSQFPEYAYGVSWDYPLLPSEYVKRQMHVCFQDDWRALRNRNVTGVEPLLWGNDYPHAEGCWPISQERIRDMSEKAGLTPAEQEAVFGGTLARLYDVDLRTLDGAAAVDTPA